MIKRIKQNYLYIIETIIFILFFIFSVFNNNITKYSFLKLNTFTMIILIVGILMIVAFSIFFDKYNNLKIENKFLFITIIIGVLYCFAFPINTIPDEANHAARAYEISNGNLISHINKGIVGNKLDSNLNKALSNDNYSKLIKNFKYKETKNKTMYNFANTALYSPISYLPQSLGILFSKIFTKSILVQLYFGRIFNFIVFTLLMYYAIKLIPFKKECIFLIGMIPLSIQEGVSLAPDAFTISLSCFFVAYILYLKDKKDKITKKQIAILSISNIVLSQLKIVYLPLCLLTFLLPKEKFMSKKHKYITLVSIIAMSSIFGMIWLKISSSYLLVQSASDKQLIYIFGNVLRYLGICMSSFVAFSRDWLYEAFGRNLGSYIITMPSFLIFGNIVLFIIYSIVLNKDKNSNKLKESDKWLIAFVIVFIVGLMFTSLYLQWTPYKATTISGIQGRYFIPLLILISLLLFNKKIVLNEKIKSKYIDLFFVFENLCAISMIFIIFI